MGDTRSLDYSSYHLRCLCQDKLTKLPHVETQSMCSHYQRGHLNSSNVHIRQPIWVSTQNVYKSASGAEPQGNWTSSASILPLHSSPLAVSLLQAVEHMLLIHICAVQNSWDQLFCPACDYFVKEPYAHGLHPFDVRPHTSGLFPFGLRLCH